MSRGKRRVCPSPQAAEHFSSNVHRTGTSPRTGRCISPSANAKAGSPSRTSAPPPHPGGAGSSHCLCHLAPARRARPSATRRARSSERARHDGRGEHRGHANPTRRRPLHERALSPRAQSAPSSSIRSSRVASQRSPWNCAPTSSGEGPPRHRQEPDDATGQGREKKRLRSRTSHTRRRNEFRLPLG
jgi:hypothetical protein